MRLNDFLIILWPHRQQNSDGRCSLRMTNVEGSRRARSRQHVIDHSRNIVEADLMPAKVPESFRLRTQSFMFQAVIVSSRVSEPNVVAVSRQ